MAYVNSAAYDPVFYLLHCFVDFVWEKFMERQRDICGVDPSIDYVTEAQESHGLDDAMTGMKYFNISDGLAPWWTQGKDRWYTYEESPTCPFCGGADSLVCDVNINRCVPHSRIQSVIDKIVEPISPPFSTTPVVPTTIGNFRIQTVIDTIVKLLTPFF